MFSLILGLFLGVVSLGVYRVLQIGKRDPRMPKGPPTIPILGNSHQIPPGGLFKQYVYAYLLYYKLTDYHQIQGMV